MLLALYLTMLQINYNCNYAIRVTVIPKVDLYWLDQSRTEMAMWYYNLLRSNDRLLNRNRAHCNVYLSITILMKNMILQRNWSVKETLTKTRWNKDVGPFSDVNGGLRRSFSYQGNVRLYIGILQQGGYNAAKSMMLKAWRAPSQCRLRYCRHTQISRHVYKDPRDKFRMAAPQPCASFMGVRWQLAASAPSLPGSKSSSWISLPSLSSSRVYLLPTRLMLPISSYQSAHLSILSLNFIFITRSIKKMIKHQFRVIN